MQYCQGVLVQAWAEGQRKEKRRKKHESCEEEHRSGIGGGQELSGVAMNADTVEPATYTEEVPQMSGEDKQGTLSDHTMEGPIGGSRRGDAFKGLKYMKSNEFLLWPCQNCGSVMGRMAAAAREGFLVTARVGWVLGERHAKRAW